MYYKDTSASECFFSMLICGVISWFSYSEGRQSAFKEIEEKTQKDKIAHLEQEIKTLKNRNSMSKKQDAWNECRVKMKLKRIS